jgi:FkbM family methyltransferase
MTFLEKIQRARNLSRVLSRGDAFKLAFSTREGATERFVAPSLGGPLHLRPGTVDTAVFEKVFLHGEYELPFTLNPRRIIDAGAHIGLASRFFAHRFPAARIVAIEPMEPNLAVLRRNAESCPQIRVQPGALWSHATALAGTNDASWSHTMHETSDAVTTIRGLTIPDILAQEGWDHVDLIKLDVEGAEREIFSDSAGEWLSRVRLIVIELHDRFYGGCSQAFYRQIAGRLEAQEIRGENVFALLRPLGS